MCSSDINQGCTRRGNPGKALIFFVALETPGKVRSNTRSRLELYNNGRCLGTVVKFRLKSTKGTNSPKTMFGLKSPEKALE